MPNTKLSSENILIWDAGALPDKNDYILIAWRRPKADFKLIDFSIQELIEINSKEIRSCYLSWLYNFPLQSINGKSLINYFRLQSDFNYWWMSVIAEKCNYSKSTYIDDIMRLMTFDIFSQERSIKSLRIITDNKILAQCFEQWCLTLKIHFECTLIKKAPKLSGRHLYNHLIPESFKALFWLARYLAKRWSLRGLGIEGWMTSTAKVTFFSYLFAHSPTDIKNKVFKSPYWGTLPESLETQGLQTNWLHIYSEDACLKSSRDAKLFISTLNMKKNSKQNHVLLDSFLSNKVVLYTLRDWSKLFFSIAFLNASEFFKYSSGFNFWRFFANDWYCSFFGIPAISALLQFNLFKEAFRILPIQNQGYYLQENQGWEFGLIQAWRLSGHKTLVGVPHSTIRFWDLRYFFDNRVFSKDSDLHMPMPSKVALNGPIALRAFSDAGYPSEDIVEVEALRYLGVNITPKELLVRSGDEVKRLLVIGDYLRVNTDRQMSLLWDASAHFSINFQITVKPHPACLINEEDFPGLPLVVVRDSIEQLLLDCDLVYASESTSGGTDAYCAGIPVVIAYNTNRPNFSPLRGVDGILFAATPLDLAQALEVASKKERVSCAHPYFNVDLQLPRWHRLLSNN